MQKPQTVFKYISLIGFAYLFFLIIEPFIATLVFAIFFAVLCHPVVVYLMKKFKIKKNLAVAIVVVTSLFFILLPLLALIGLIATEAFVFIGNFNSNEVLTMLENASNVRIFNYNFDPSILKDQLQNLLQNAGGTIYTVATSIGSGVTRFTFLFVVFVFMYFYFLKDGEILLKKGKALLPFTPEQNNKLLKSFKEISKIVFLGNAVTAVLSGIAAGIGFALFGIQGAVIWGLLAGLLSLIPNIGTFIIYLLGAAVTYYLYGIYPAIGFVAYFVLIDLIMIQNIVRPRLLDSKFSIHPILVFLSLVGGVEAFGAGGLVYGPIIVILFVSIFNFWIQTDTDKETQ